MESLVFNFFTENFYFYTSDVLFNVIKRDIKQAQIIHNMNTFPPVSIILVIAK